MNEITHKIFSRTQLLKTFMLCTGALALSANAAVVTVTTPGGTDGSSYMVPMDSTVFDVYNNIESGPGIGSLAGNDGEELILLGAHETILHSSDASVNGCIAAGTCNDVMEVEILSANNGGPTGPVSLLLSASESLIWDLTYDPAAQIDLRSIFIFGASFAGQSLRINGVDIVIDDVLQSNDLGINVDVSTARICAFAHPVNEGGCNTEDLLGFGLFDNFLAEETDLEVTNFNGSEYVDRFEVLVDSTAQVPLPGSLLLFSSILGVSVGLGRKFK